MLQEAKRLSDEQVKARGSIPWLGVDGKKTRAPGPYVPTPENEQRARRILHLRRKAARTKE